MTGLKMFDAHEPLFQLDDVGPRGVSACEHFIPIGPFEPTVEQVRNMILLNQVMLGRSIARDNYSFSQKRVDYEGAIVHDPIVLGAGNTDALIKLKAYDFVDRGPSIIVGQGAYSIDDNKPKGTKLLLGLLKRI